MTQKSQLIPDTYLLLCFLLLLQNIFFPQIRLMCLWSLTLPLAMYPLTGPIWTLPFSVLLSYVVLSIEDIGVEIEEPFYVLPMRQYTEGEYACCLLLFYLIAVFFLDTSRTEQIFFLTN